MKFLTKNIAAKILALLCAVFLWVYIAAGESKVGFFPGSLTIEAKNTPAGLAAIYDEQKVKVKIQAPYEIWNRLGADNFKASIDLAGLEEGTYEIEVRVEVDIPSVIIIEKDPSKIIVRLETIAKKEVDAVVKFEGEAKTGYVPGEVTVSPPKVEVEGAKSLIETLSQATALIKLSGEDEDFKRTILLGVYNEKGEKQTGIKFTPESVDVEVQIVAASENKTVGVKVKTKGKPSSDYFVAKIETTPATVEISGSDSDLKSILFIETKEVDIEGITKDLEKDIELVTLSGISFKEKRVRVKISLSPNLISREITASFVYSGLSPSLTVSSVSPNIIKTVVSGPSSIINNLSSDQVMITFNLAGKAAGSHFFNIEKSMIALPEGCAAASWLPSAVTITLQ